MTSKLLRLLLATLILLFVYSFSTKAQSISINEVMASNASSISDEDGDYSDWIELYNFGTEAINLTGYGLSDSYNNPFKWVFPDTVIQAGEFMIIWASGKNLTIPGQPLHTSYSISADGEEITLTSPDLVLVDEMLPVAIPSDISYGKFPDATGTWYFFYEPTPGLSNSTHTYTEVLSPPVFSHSGGFYSNPFELNIAHPDPEVTIIYTLDGSLPDIENIAGTTYLYKNSYPRNPGQPFGEFLSNSFLSFEYSSPILVYDRSAELDKLTQISSTFDANPSYFPSTPVQKVSVVRARSFKPQAIPSTIATETYLINYPSAINTDLPIISICAQEDAFFDYEAGIYVAGIDFDEWRMNNPTLPWAYTSPANYIREGDEWEQLANFEFFSNHSSSSQINQSIGLRIHGGASRTAPRKSLRLYSRNSYGEEFLNYRFFSSIQDSSFKRLILRNSGSDWSTTIIKDAAIQTIVASLNINTQAYQPVILFVNGEYWGIHNLRERYDKHYLARVYGVDSENLDILELNGRIKEGDAIHYQAMLNFIAGNSLSEPINYEYVKTHMDEVNFIDYQIAQIFSRNTDWPGANIDYWRLKTNSYQPNSPQGHDGRWRWLLFDTDLGFGYTGGNDAFTHNTLEFATVAGGVSWPNPDWSTFLLRNLLTNEVFKLSFVNRFADLLNTTFLPGRMIDIITELKTTIEPEMPAHIHRWNRPMSMTVWEGNINLMINFANQRPFYQRQHIREHFNIHSDINISLDVSNPDHGYIRINTINITPETPGVPEVPYPWTGIYFHNIPIEVEAISNPGYAFSHWTGSASGDEATLGLTPTGNISLTAHFIPLVVSEPELIHYWHFNTLSGTVTAVESDFSVTTPGIITYPGTGPGYLDERTHRAADPVSNLNLQMGQLPDQGAVLRVRNPSDTREMIIAASTAGFEDIAVNFATTRTSNGAQGQEFYYSTDGGQSWVLHASYPVIEQTSWELKTFDLSSIAEVNENPDLQFRILFTGSNASLTAGNARFDNFSVHGISSLIPLEFYSKATGDLNILSTWGSEPDGSGTAPTSFSNDATTFYVQNRELGVLENNWTISGLGSKVVVGNGIVPSSLQLNAWLDALVDVSANAVLILTVEDYPTFGLMDENSAIVFSEDAQFIPYHSYHHLEFDDINPVFTGHGNITVQGNITLKGIVNMPDARGGSQYNLIFSGNATQLINTNGNVLRSYNMSFIKDEGSIAFGTGSVISTDNQLISNITSGATFSDNGITIYAGNSVNLAGAGDSYEFTGTLILAGTEEGIIKGSGAENNFNIRLSESSNTNMVAALNNLVVRVENIGGEFRFRDGTSNEFRIKGNLLLESEAAGRLRFYNNHVLIGGNFIIEGGFAGTLDAIVTLSLTGGMGQGLEAPFVIQTQQLIIDNDAGSVHLNATIEVANQLDLLNGIVHTAENVSVILGLNAQLSGVGETNFINGTLGILTNNTETRNLYFPVGEQQNFLPVTFSVAHANSNELLYSATATEFDAMGAGPGEEMEFILDDYMYRIDVQGDPAITTASINLTFLESGLGFEPELLRIVRFNGNVWIDLGGEINNGSISSTANFTETGYFALAKAAVVPDVPETLLLQNMNLLGTTDTCFAATQTITLAGEGTSFNVESGGIVRLIAGANILFLDGVVIEQGAWLHAFIDDSGEYCGMPETMLSAKREETIIFHYEEMANSGTAFFIVYPNPSKGILTLETFDSAEQQSLTIEVFNIFGECLLREETPGNTKLKLDLSNNPAGLYFIRVNNGVEWGVEKIIVQ